MPRLADLYKKDITGRLQKESVIPTSWKSPIQKVVVNIGVGSQDGLQVHGVVHRGTATLQGSSP